MATITGAQALIKAIEQQGTEVAFGVPGGAILPAYDPMLDAGFRHILARHEQGAGHMAEGYAWATGKAGVVIATSGPGATNLVTPLVDALMDSVPMVAITGQVPTHAVGNDAFQEAYTTGITMPATKHNHFVTDPEEIGQAVAEAFHLAGTGRPGPVLVDIPKDVLNAQPGPGGTRVPSRCRATNGPLSTPITCGSAEAIRHHRGLRAPRPLRRRRDNQGGGRRGAHPPSPRPDQHPGRNHPDGKGGDPRQPPQRASGCRECTASTRPPPPYRSRTC